MIIFYRTKNCPACQAIEDILKELCIAFEVMIVGGKGNLPKSVPVDSQWPLLIDEGKIIQGSKNIINHLNELEEFKNQWYKFQSYVCYCEES
jgi:glutaredoxin